MRTVTLVSGRHGSVLDYVETFVAVLDDLGVEEIRQVEDGRLRRIRRRDPAGRWTVEKVDLPA